MYDDWDYTATATGSFTTGTTTGGVGTITIPALGGTTSSNQWVTVTGGGGGGGAYYNNNSGKIYTTGVGAGGAPGWSDVTTQTTIVIGKDGEIYRGNDRKNGLFQRLERLERMLGILHRDADLESQWEPLREIGDAYDEVCDEAIRRISEVVAGELKVLQDQYEDAKTQAKVYIKLSKDD